MVPSAIALVISLANGDDILAVDLASTLLGLMMLVLAFHSSRGSSRTTEFIWQKGDPLAPIAEARGMNASGLIAIPVIVCMSIVIGTFLFDDIPMIFPATIAVLLSIAVSAGLLRSKVFAQRDSILVGIPTGILMAKLPLDRVESINLRGRLLKVVLVKKVNPLSSRTARFVILGDARPLATAIQAMGMVGGLNTSVENAEVDTELLKSLMSTIRGDGVTGPREAGDRYVIDERQLAPSASPYPEIVSSLLVAAGIAAFVTAFIFAMIEGRIAEEYGIHASPLECCAALEVLFGVIIVAGAVMARRRKRYGFVRVSAVIAIISIGGLISTVLGIISLVLLAKCADEFSD